METQGISPKEGKLSPTTSSADTPKLADEPPSWDQLVAKAAVTTNPKPSILLHRTPEPGKNKSKNEFSNADLAEKMSGAPGPNRPFTEPNIAEETTPPDQNPPTSDSTSTREEKPILGEEVIDMMQGSDGRWTTEPEKRPLGRKILRAVGNGVKAWAQNLDFRGKDKAWAIGMGVGVAESAAITFLMPAGPAKGLIKAGINALVLQGYYFGTNRIYGVHKSAVQRRYTGEGLTGRLAKIQENKESADEKMKNFFHGISAGAVYGSFGGLALSIGISAVTEMGVNLPEVKLPGIPKIGIPEIPKVNIPGVPHIEMPKIPDSEQVGQLIEGVKEKTTGISGEIHKGINEIKSLLGQPNTEIPADKAAEIANKVAKIEALQKVSDLVNSPDNPAAAAVGAHLNYTNDMVNQVLAAQHINPTSLSAQDYEALRLAVQHGLEAQSNNSFAAAAEEVASFDANNAGDVSHVLDRGKEIFENSLSDPTKQELFRHIAEQTLSAQQETHTAIIDHLIAAIPADHITSVDLGPGMTATQLLEDHGYTNVYDPVVLGEHVIVNYPLVDNMWGNMAQSYGWSEHFPISLPELDQLIAAAKNGDPEAILKLQKLQPATLRALHWLPVGGKFKILSPSNN